MGGLSILPIHGGFSLGVGLDHSDDLIGGKQVPYSSFQGDGASGTMRMDEWPALRQWTEWIGPGFDAASF